MSQQNRRPGPQRSPQQPAGQALAPRQEAGSIELAAGTYSNLGELKVALQKAESEANLISPATSVGRLPEGTSIALTMVHIDISKNDKGFYNTDDTYDVGGYKRGLSKTVLFKIAAALGISWDPIASGRVDDGSDPYYCRWLAVGQYRAFDGQIQTLQGSKEMDLRDESPQVRGLYERYQTAVNADDPGTRAKAKDPTGQIREMRIHIQAHAETKAQLRALRSLGIKTSYTLDELSRPFAVARIMFTGVTRDPQLKAMFAEKIADSFLGARHSLYGAGPVSSQTPSAPISHRLASPPPVGSVPVEDDDFIDAEGENEAPAQQQQQTRAPAQERQPANTQQQQQAPQQQQQPRGDAVGSDYVLRFGKSKGATIAAAPAEHLEWMAVFLEEKLDAGESQYPDQDRALINGLYAELDKRNADKEKL